MPSLLSLMFTTNVVVRQSCASVVFKDLLRTYIEEYHTEVKFKINYCIWYAIVRYYFRSDIHYS